MRRGVVVAHNATAVASAPPDAAHVSTERAAAQPQTPPRALPARAREVCSRAHANSGAMTRTPAHDTPAIQSLDRGLAILQAVANSPAPVPLKQLTELIGIDRSSVFRLANTLRQRRFLANPKGSKDYILRPSASRLSRRYRPNAPGTFFHPSL